MEKQKEKGKFKGDFSLITITLVALVLVIFHNQAGQKELDPHPQSRMPQSEEAPKRVFPLDVLNRGLQDVHQQRELNQKRQKLDNYNRPKNMDQQKYTDLETLETVHPNFGLKIQPENPAADIAKKASPALPRMNYNRIDSEVGRSLANEQTLAEYDEAYRREYIRQFLENAKKDGYQIILNKDLSIREIKQLNPAQ